MAEEIVKVSRIRNGWIVTSLWRHGDDEERFCATWEEVEKVAKEAAFPFGSSEPRGPHDA